MRALHKVFLCLGIAAAASSIGVLWPAPKAEAAFNLTLSPLPLNLTTTPGQPITAPIRFQNNGSEAVRLKVSLMKFSANGTSGEPAIQEPTPQDTFIKWASFSQSEFVARPGVFNTVNVTIKPPKSAAFGYYYAVVFNQADDRQASNERENSVSGAVANLVLLNVQAPGEKRQLEVTRFTANRKLFQYLPAGFNIETKNTGNIHVVPSGNIFIRKAGKPEIIGTLKINEAQGNVLPNSSRAFTSEWLDGFPSYQYKRQNNQIVTDQNSQPVKELSWDLKNANKFRLGKYTASMTLVYNDGQRDVPIEGTVSFWVVPWVPFLIILVILILIAIGIFVLLRNLYKKVKKIRKKDT